MEEFHGECIGVFTIHHILRWKQRGIFFTNMYASLLQTFHAWLYASFPTQADQTEAWTELFLHSRALVLGNSHAYGIDLK